MRGLYLRGPTWYLDCRIHGERHVVNLGKNISRTAASEIATAKRASILQGKNHADDSYATRQLYSIVKQEPPVFPSPQPNIVHTYFILNPDLRHVKIGKSRDVEKRLKMLQTSTGSRLYFIGSVDSDQESRLHDHLSKHRILGEWFYWNDEVRKIVMMTIKGLSAKY